jgi:peroxiredoxin
VWSAVYTRRMNFFLAALFLLAATPGIASASGEAAAALSLMSPKPLKPAKDFQVSGHDNRPLNLADFKGKVVFLNFWATWCKPCEQEMPAMQRLYDALRGSGFELLAISVDDAPGPVEGFRSRLGLRFPILLDADQRVAHAYQTFRFPETLLVDADGEIVERYVGPKEWDAEAYVERIRRLAQAAVPSRPGVGGS